MVSSDSSSAETASGANLQIKTEGPYGRPVRKHNTQSHTLLLVAGGVGISPFVDLLCNMSQDATWWHKASSPASSHRTATVPSVSGKMMNYPGSGFSFVIPGDETDSRSAPVIAVCVSCLD